MKKYLTVIPFIAIGGLALFLCCKSGDNVSKASTSGASAKVAYTSENSVERYYFVKGMTCGGCVFGVKTALKRAGLSSEQIVEVDYSSPDPENSIGHAKVRFLKDKYKGKETDCKIVKEIKDNPGYITYWDKGKENPCG